MAMTFREAKRTIKRFILELQGPLTEAEHIQTIFNNGEITDVDWKKLSPQAQARVMQALANHQGNLLTQVEEAANKINPPVEP